MKAIMITAPSSGSGKTLITLGLLRALKKRGLNICGFKTGPDYIDNKFIEISSGKRAGNLDFHLMGDEGVKNAIAMGEGEYAVVEGAMGYFDGIYNTFRNSSFDISRKLDINTILVYTPKGEMFSIIPKIKGMVDFEGSKIKGIILNKVSERMYLLLKEKIEEYVGIKVFGYIERSENLKVESRHLGLVQGIEIKGIEEIIDRASEMIEKNVDIDSILSIVSEINTQSFNYPKKRNITVGIAYDKAFSFYYSENLKLLENVCNVKYFSPLKEKIIPDCDIIYFGGGYPEVYKYELSKNIEVLKSIKSFADNGGFIYGECGGFMYLTQEIEGVKMCQIFKGKSMMTQKLQRFGYINIELKEDCLLGQKGDTLTGHEFHKSVSVVDQNEIFSITTPMGKRNWSCGYRYKNVLAGYPHINFLGNMKAFNSIMNRIVMQKPKDNTKL